MNNELVEAYIAGFREAGRWPHVFAQDADSRAVREAAEQYAAAHDARKGGVVSDAMAAEVMRRYDGSRPDGGVDYANRLRSMRAALEAAGCGVDKPISLESVRTDSEWLPILSAPKSVVDGNRVGGIYLLGYNPDAETLDGQAAIDVIWWEPLLKNSKGGRGKWCASSFGEAVEAHPTHWMPLPIAPNAAIARKESDDAGRQ